MTKWTKEEEETLYRLWGKLKFESIQKKLGKTERSIRMKVFRMKLGAPGAAGEDYVMSDVAKIIDRKYQVLMYWRDHHGFPAIRKDLSRFAQWMVSPKHFWAWVKDHPEKISVADVPRGAITPEPKWVEEERGKIGKTKRQKQKAWTMREINLVKHLRTEGKSSVEIAEIIGRTRYSVEHVFRNKDGRR